MYYAQNTNINVGTVFYIYLSRKANEQDTYSLIYNGVDPSYGWDKIISSCRKMWNLEHL